MKISFSGRVWLVIAVVGLAACAAQAARDPAPSSTSTVSEAVAPDILPEPGDTTSIATAPTMTSNVDSIPPLEPRGWPKTSVNAPGVYSWDGARCAGQWCNVGFMHNGYGSGDVDIFFSTVLDGYKPINYEGATAVTVAGRDGTYHRKDGRFNLQEEWIVDIEGTRIGVRIRLEAPMDTSQADLVEAHAIIDSIRSEPMDNDLGFRLVFTLSTDDWDSG